MECIYAAMLLHKAGKQVTAEAVKKVLEAAGLTPDESRIKALVAALEGVDIDAAIKEASTMTAVAAAPATPVAQEAPKKEEKKEEKKVSEEEAAAGLGALFG